MYHIVGRIPDVYLPYNINKPFEYYLTIIYIYIYIYNYILYIIVLVQIQRVVFPHIF